VQYSTTLDPYWHTYILGDNAKNAPADISAMDLEC